MNDYYHDFLNQAYEKSEQARHKKELAEYRRALAGLKLPGVSLLLRTPPYLSENLESWMYRVAERNALKAVSELERAFQLPIGKPLSTKRRQQFSDSFGGDAAAVTAMLPVAIDRHTVSFGQHTLLKRHLAFTTSRLCPHCVAEYGYGKLHWDLAPFAVCEEHGVYLIDQCQCKSDAVLNSSRPSYAVCQCGANLCESPTISATPAARALSRKIVRQFKGEPAETCAAKDGRLALLPVESSLADLLDLIMFLGSLNRKHQIMNLAFARPLMRMKPVIAQFEKAARALSNWPIGLFSLLREVGRSSSRVVTSASVYEGLQSVSKAAEERLPTHLQKWFLDAVAQFLATPTAWHRVAPERPQIWQE